MTSPLPGTVNQVSPEGIRPEVRPAWLLIGPAFATLSGAFLFALVVATATDVQLAVGMPTSMRIWISVGYLLPALLAYPVGAMVGRRWPTAVSIAGIVLLMLGTLLTALAPASGPLLLGNAMAGFGAGLTWGVTATLIARAGARRVLMLSLVAGAVVLSLCLGAVVGTFLARHASWRPPFLLAVPFELVALLVAAVSGIVALVQGQSRPTR